MSPAYHPWPVGRQPRFAALLLGIVVMTACAPGQLLGPKPTKDPIAGVYIARGGGGALDNVLPLTQAFSRLHPTFLWQGLDDIGSDAGIRLVQSGELDVAFISRELRDSDVGVATLSIGATGTGVAVSTSNRVSVLTKQQLGKVFRGEITDWRDVGGDPGPIHVLLREAGAATRMTLESYCFGGKPLGGYAKNAIEVTSYEETVRAIKGVQGSVGVMSMTAAAFSEQSIKLVSIDGVPPTREALSSRAYPMRRPLYLVYSADPQKVKPGIRAFLDYVRSPEGQQLLASL